MSKFSGFAVALEVAFFCTDEVRGKTGKKEKKLDEEKQKEQKKKKTKLQRNLFMRTKANKKVTAVF